MRYEVQPNLQQRETVCRVQSTGGRCTVVTTAVHLYRTADARFFFVAFFPALALVVTDKLLSESDRNALPQVLK